MCIILNEGLICAYLPLNCIPTTQLPTYHSTAYLPLNCIPATQLHTYHSTAYLPLNCRDYMHQRNCMMDCNGVMDIANQKCFNTAMDQCIHTNPYGGGSAACGYGTIKKKKNAKCSKCRCQVVKDNGGNTVCGIGRFDDHCTPSQN